MNEQVDTDGEGKDSVTDFTRTTSILDSDDAWATWTWEVTWEVNDELNCVMKVMIKWTDNPAGSSG